LIENAPVASVELGLPLFEVVYHGLDVELAQRVLVRIMPSKELLEGFLLDSYVFQACGIVCLDDWDPLDLIELEGG